MRKNEIIINIDNELTYNKNFAPIDFQISFEGKKANINYYLHKCDKVEYKEVLASDIAEEELIQNSLNTPETIYFYNTANESDVFQANSHRKKATEEEALAGEIGTLYFINEEES